MSKQIGIEIYGIPLIITRGENAWRITKEIFQVLAISNHGEAGRPKVKFPG